MRALSLPYELRLGITGHRQLEDEPAVAGGVARLLDRIDGTLNQQDVAPLSWTVVSALARGADRLFAEAVLDNKRGRLEVITPFPVDEYRKDFDAETDSAHFERLLARAGQVQQLEMVPGVAAPAGDSQVPADEAAYLTAGERLVDSSEILVAIWNGRGSPGGGTADVVQYAVQQERVVIWLDSSRPDDPPKLVRSVRYSSDGLLDSACTTEFPPTANLLSRGYHQQARYCLDDSLPSELYARHVGQRCGELVHMAETSGLDSVALDTVLAGIVPQFVRADQLARHYQRRHGWSVGGVLYVAAAAVTVAVGQVLFFPDRLWLILFEVLAMLLVLGLWWFGRREAWHEKWLHDRYLAERLRTTTFTALVGAISGQANDGDPLPFYRGPQHWLARCVDTLARSATAVPEQVPFEAVRRFVAMAWLRDQERFHSDTARRAGRRAARRHALGFGLFGATLLMASLHFMGIGHESGSGRPTEVRLDLWITFLALVLPVWAGTIHAMTSQLELERIAERSRRMGRALGRMARQAGCARTPGELRRICTDAATLMTVENREWWVLLSFHELRLHV